MNDEKNGILSNFDIFWLKTRQNFWHQNISLFLPVKYLDLRFTLIIFIASPFFLMFTVFCYGSVYFILNVKIVLFYSFLC